MDFLAAAATLLSEESSKNKKRKFQLCHESLVSFPDAKKSLLSKRLRRWCMYEHFYCSIDLGFFAENEFTTCLKLLALDHVVSAKKAQWTAIRNRMGKEIGRPRRLSNAFLKGERDKLEAFRQTIRLSQSGRKISFDAEFPYEINEPIRVGDRVALYLPKSQEFHQGTILSIMRSPAPTESSQYLVQFDEASEGDGVVAPPMLFTDAYLTVLKTAVDSPKPVTSPKMGLHPINRSVINEEQSRLTTAGTSPLSACAIQDLLTSKILTQNPDENSRPFPIRGTNRNPFSSNYSQEDSIAFNGVFSQRSVMSFNSVDDDYESKVSPSQLTFSQSSAFDVSRGSMTHGASLSSSLLQTVANTRPPLGTRPTETTLDKFWKENERTSGRLFEDCLAKLDSSVVYTPDSGTESMEMDSDSSGTSTGPEGVSLSKAVQYIKGNEQMKRILVKCIAGLLTVSQKDIVNYQNDVKMSYWIEKISSELREIDNFMKVESTHLVEDNTNLLESLSSTYMDAMSAFARSNIQLSVS